jgi:O-antigen ligase
MATLGHPRGDASASAIDTGVRIHIVPALSYLTFLALLVYSAIQTMLGGALDESFSATVGPLNVYVYDLLLFAALTLLLREVVVDETQSVPAANRFVVFVALGYCAYQLAIVLPVAVLFHDLDPIGVFRELEERLGLMLLPFMYLVVLKYVPIRRVILLVNVTAVAVALYAMQAYVTAGPNLAIGKFRQVDGHASFLFAFLILTSLFLSRPSVLSYAAAMLGLIGTVFANHRSAYLALLAVGIPLFFHFRRASVRTVVVLLIVLSAAVLVVSTSPTIRDSVYYSFETMVNPTADQNTRDRIDRSRLGWDFFVANPLGDHTWNQRFYLIDLPYTFEPHNFVIQILNAQGVMGFALVAALFFAVLRIAWRNRSADRVTAVMLAAFAFYLLFSLFNTTIFTAYNIVMLAVPAGIILKRNADLRSERERRTEDALSATPGTRPA